MAYDPALADRIRDALAGTPGLVEKKMFGGIGWTVGGHMAAGAHNDGRLMIRCSKDDFAGFIAQEGAGGMQRGKTLMTGWVLVAPEAVDDQADLEMWVHRGRDYAASMPPKK